MDNSAVSHSIAIEYQMNQIDELIGLAGSAARSGNYDLAHKYEESLKRYGVEIVTASNAESALAKLGMANSSNVTPANYDVALPEDTSSVHWYKYTAPGYYNYRTGGNYDLISITAVSWDDTNSYLHYDQVIKYNTNRKTYLRGILEQSVDTVVSMAIDEIPYASAIITLADIHTTAKAATAEYISVEIAPNDLVVHWNADRTIRFWYVRSTGSGTGYGLWYVEEKIAIETLAIMTIRIKNADGSVETDIIYEHIPETVYLSTNYGDMTRPCDACKNREFRKSELNDVKVTLLDEILYIPHKYLPSIPEVIIYA